MLRVLGRKSARVRGEDSDPGLEVGPGRVGTGCGGPWGPGQPVAGGGLDPGSWHGFWKDSGRLGVGAGNCWKTLERAECVEVGSERLSEGSADAQLRRLSAFLVTLSGDYLSLAVNKGTQFGKPNFPFM